MISRNKQTKRKGNFEMKKRKTIGFLLHHIEDDYAQSLIKGAIEAAEELDINIVFLPGRAIDSAYSDKAYSAFEYQNNVLFGYANKESMDGCVVTAGAIGTFVDDDKLKNFLDSFKGLPILTIERKVQGYPCVKYDDDGMYEAVEHLISEHHCRDIRFLAGPKTNPDSESRLNAYRRALEAYGIEFRQDRVYYSDFTEYTVEITEKILDAENMLPDAICCANDLACIGVYTAMKNRGLVPGKDVLVTGFDNSPTAYMLSPMLTTVAADPEPLGFSSVMTLVQNLDNLRQLQDITLNSHLVIRGSCGCEDRRNLVVQKLLQNTLMLSADRAIDVYADRFIKKPDTAKNRRYKQDIAKLFLNIVNDLSFDEQADLEEDTRRIITFLEKQSPEMIEVDAFLGMVDCVGKYASRRCDFNRVMVFLSDIYKHALYFSIRRNYALISENARANFLLTGISRDMMQSSTGEKGNTFAALEKMMLLGARSTGMYRYRDSFINKADREITLPDTIRLLGYQVGDKIVTVEASDEAYVPINKCLDNDYMPDEPKTMVMIPLYTNEVQYGVLVCDLPREKYLSLYYVGPQMSTSITTNALLQYLEGSLEEVQDTNEVLNEMSMHDELTGLFNRRGFFRNATDAIEDPRNNGRIGMFLFADVDNLKLINDGLGHEAGDYAIMTSADYLKKALRKEDIIARIGGDEMVAFAILECEEQAKLLYQRIKAIAAEHNASSDKNFNVTISIGTCTFECSKTISVSEYLDKSDEQLYEDKARKNKNIWK